HHEIAQRHRADQSISLRIYDVTRVDRLFLLRDSANVLQSLADSHLRIEPDKFSGHDPARSVIGIPQQVFELGAHFSTELRHESMPIMNPHLLNDVSALVGRETFENCSNTGRLDLFENRRAATHRRLIE